MSTSDSHPFSAATNKLAYAQAFAGPTGHRGHKAAPSSLRLGRRLSLLRRPRRG